MSDRSAIVVYSYHHNNTQKIAHAMAEVLNTRVQMPENTAPEKIQDLDLVGFGAGIDSGKHYKPLLDFAKELPVVQGKKAFIFSTCGVPNQRGEVTYGHKALKEILLAKGYRIVGEFQCAGYNTNSILKYFGGMNRNRPNADDFAAARAFAQNLTK